MLQIDLLKDETHAAYKRRVNQWIKSGRTNGAEGDLSIGHRSDLSAVGVIAAFRTFQKAEELGTLLAESVLAGLSSLEYEEPDLDAARYTVRLPLNPKNITLHLSKNTNLTQL